MSVILVSWGWQVEPWRNIIRSGVSLLYQMSTLREFERFHSFSGVQDFTAFRSVLLLSRFAWHQRVPSCKKGFRVQGSGFRVSGDFGVVGLLPRLYGWLGGLEGGLRGLAFQGFRGALRALGL